MDKTRIDGIGAFFCALLRDERASLNGLFFFDGNVNRRRRCRGAAALKVVPHKKTHDRDHDHDGAKDETVILEITGMGPMKTVTVPEKPAAKK